LTSNHPRQIWDSDRAVQVGPDRLGRGLVACAVAMLGCVLLAGCSNRQPYVTPARLERGLVIVLPGIEGRSPLNEAICEGLAAGGVDYAIETYDWTFPFFPLYNLRAERRNRRKAAELVARILRYRMAYPGCPVVLVGQSGGGAIAIWAAEEMPPGQQVDGLIVLAPSLSPSYMLDSALAGSQRGIVNFYSSRDWLFLRIGTTVTGTMDGQHDVSAGSAGFDVPSGVRSGSYQKLHQIGWTSEMAEKGHSGMHLTSGAVGYVSSYVAPFVLGETWGSELVSRVLETAATRPAVATKPPVESRPTSLPSRIWRPKLPNLSDLWPLDLEP